MGPKSSEFAAAILNVHPEWADFISATGSLPHSEVSTHIQACDLMIQPYPDGITTRRGSAMAALAHGRPVVTTHGFLTESFWQGEPAIIMESATDMNAMAGSIMKLIQSDSERSRLGRAALELYNKRFHISHTIAAIRSDEYAHVA
jgi:glycosyltransferase involved in cell wall biosynthesis